VREGFGDVFPTLPFALLGPRGGLGRVSDESETRSRIWLKISDFERGGRDSKTLGSSDSRWIRDDSRTKYPPRVDVSARELVDVGPTGNAKAATVEDLLSQALACAAEVGRWDVVAQLARELEARRLEAQGVIAIGRRGQRT
jgi:hypothetical protein